MGIAETDVQIIAIGWKKTNPTCIGWFLQKMDYVFLRKSIKNATTALKHVPHTERRRWPRGEEVVHRVPGTDKNLRLVASQDHGFALGDLHIPVHLHHFWVVIYSRGKGTQSNRGLTGHDTNNQSDLHTFQTLRPNSSVSALSYRYWC